MSLSIIILAAGKGKRMISTLPKVLHTIGGMPLLSRVIHTAQLLKPEAIYVVYGNGGAQVRQALSDMPVQWIEQKQQLGTGHAVLQAVPECKNTDRILILYGDVPLISLDTLQDLLTTTPKQALGVLVTTAPDPTGFGRIIRDKKNNIVKIVEQKDANPTQLKINEINTGIITAPLAKLKKWLPQLTARNQQKEYYLTDIIAAAVADKCKVIGVEAHSPQEVQGVNDRWELAKLERYYQSLAAKEIALAGVTLADPYRLDIRSNDIKIDADVSIDINVILSGKIRIGSHSQIGPNVVLKNVTLGKNVHVLANSVLEDCAVEDNCQVGPFARLRPGTLLKENAKVGNFVEIKKTTLGKGSKAPHLTYLGDATIGSDVNVGAGTITCNYDGVNKSPTVIEDKAFIGSNTSLVAPVTIAKGATIGAGSTITENAPAEQLTIARARQQTIKNWQRPKKE